MSTGQQRRQNRKRKKTKQNKIDLQSDDYYWKSSTTCSSSDAIVVLESSSLSSACIVHCAGEANFLGGVAKKYGVKDFDPVSAKQRFFEIYIDKVRVFKSNHQKLTAEL
jgi:hypothetical protein